jgi:hypothetical protein
MNVHHLSFEDACDAIQRSLVLHSCNLPGGGTLYVVEYGGNDALIVTELMTGSALVIESNDASYGGSIHEHTRRAIELGTL